MKDKIFRILFFVLLFALQVVISNYLDLGPYVYLCLLPLILLNVPMSAPTWFVMVISFAIGLALDVFTEGVLGMNSAAAVMMAFSRKAIFKVTAKRDRQDRTEVPSAMNIGFSKYLSYISACTALYMLVYILLDCVGFSSFLFIIIKFAISTALNVAAALAISRSIPERS